LRASCRRSKHFEPGRAGRPWVWAWAWAWGRMGVRFLGCGRFFYQTSEGSMLAARQTSRAEFGGRIHN
jgi:hypothetical protein